MHIKTITTLTAVAALIGGISFANAQNSGNMPSNNTSPSSINAGTQKGTGDMKSGMESKGAAMQKKSTKKHMGKTAQTPAPNSINAGTRKGTGDSKSGTQSKTSAMKRGGKISRVPPVGSGKGENPSPADINAGTRTGTGDSKSGNQ